MIRTIFTLMLVIGNALAQSGGAIRGRVLDPSGGVVPGAKVTARSAAGERDVSTGGDGTYVLQSLAAGQYSVSASVTGFLGESTTLTLLAGEEKTINPIIRPASQGQQIRSPQREVLNP